MFLLFQRRNNTISPFRFRFKFSGRGVDVRLGGCSVKRREKMKKEK